MIYTVVLILSFTVWCAAVLSTVINRLHGRKNRVTMSAMNLVLIGTFISAAIMFIPIYQEQFGEGNVSGIKTFLISIHNTLRMFILDGEFDIIKNYAKELPARYDSIYSVWAAFLYILAPVLTFGVVLSFIKNLSAYRRYLFQYGKEAHIFSALNERSLALAKSIRAKFPKAAIVFTDVSGQDDGHSTNMMEKARSIQAICFRNDITSQIIRRHGKRAPMSFYVMGENSAEDTEHTLSLIHDFKMRADTRLYVFSSRVETELLIHSAMKDAPRIMVFRVDEAQSLVYRFLYEHSIFENALPIENEKLISAVILGLGQYGSEMLKALCWCGQMNGYRLQINIFDADPRAYERFAAACPELISQNKNNAPDEAHYSINFHSGIDYRSPEFTQILENLPVSFTLVSLGDDPVNLDAALYLRQLFERQNQYPEIYTVIYSSVQANLIRKYRLVNFKGQDYRIEVIGDERYSYDAVVNSDLECEALKRHTRWGSKEDFYRFAYYYRASTATAIHAKWRDICGIPEEDLPELEHKRWSAYIRAEGYVYSGSKSAASRNDLAKTHNALVGFTALPAEEVKKDVDMTSK